MEQKSKLINFKYKSHKKHHKIFLFMQLIITSDLIQFIILFNIRNKFILLSKTNEILLKVNEIGTFPIIFSSYSFKPDSYYLNNDPTQKVFDGSDIKFTETENEVKLIFENTVGNCNSMFKGCSNITEIDLSNFISPNNGTIDSMFQDCTSLKKIIFGNFQTSKITSMISVFHNCLSLESLDLSSFNTSNVIHFHYMFYGCSSLKYLDLSNFECFSCRCVNNMFNGCTSITSINLCNFDTSKIEIIYNAFYNCNNLISLDLSSFAINTAPKPENIQNTFYGCKSLEFMNFKKFVISSNNLKIYEDMIKNSEKNIVLCSDKSKTLSNQVINQKDCSLKIYDCSNMRDISKKIISDSNICVESYSLTSYPFEYLRKCSSTYPNGTINSIGVGYEQYYQYFQSQNITSTELINILIEYVSSLNFPNLFNGTNFLAAILSSKEINHEELLKKGISFFDLGNCTNVLKEFYELEKDDNLIAINREIKIDKNKSNTKNDSELNLAKKYQLEIYNRNGTKLDLTVCKEHVTFFISLADEGKIDFNFVKNFAEKGIDIFDASHDFFNDLCYLYDDNGIDIPIKDRRLYIYQKAYFCRNGCTYGGINYTLMAVNCICNTTSDEEKENNITTNYKENEVINFKNIKNSFLSNLFIFNFEVLRCYNLVLNLKILIHNYGFYSLFLMLILQIIFLSIYLSKKLNLIENFIKSINRKRTKKKKRNRDKIIKNKSIIDNNEQITINKNILFPPIKNKDKLNEPKNANKKNRLINLIQTKSDFFSSKSLAISQMSLNINNQNNSKKINDDTKNNNIQQDNNEKEIIGNNNLNKSLKNNDNNNEFNTKKHGTSKSLENFYDIQNVDYEEAKNNDKRGYLRMYWGFLVDTQIIFDTFCTDNHLDLFAIKLSFFVFNFQISFFLNALFYTDEYISDAYHNNGILDFVSGLPKSIYSYIVTLIMANILRMLSTSKNELLRIITKKMKYKY